ncbi:hypothetical protein BSK59_16205 [Paenibacillus odorifer]|uniref:hypothetical protein n=1 Tax=Paenibacillus odorifer TaxID=189426 RepID=UPI00096F0751|nr:hypothetical protein [Paenibacillus odorifer]OME54122.1 hypothetical protein BSK59_16205 [Paenibacillus odorifer]
MTDDQQQWVIINRKTGTIFNSRIYLSEKTATSINKNMLGANKHLKAVELKRDMLLSLLKK